MTDYLLTGQDLVIALPCPELLRYCWASPANVIQKLQ